MTSSILENVKMYLLYQAVTIKRKMIQIPLRAGHHRPTSETPFEWPKVIAFSEK